MNPVTPIVDLRSDALSQPTERMFAAMSKASNTDDVFDRNETMDDLHRMASQMLGMESALFLASGTMANLVAALVLARPGDGAVVDRLGHVSLSEPGFAAFAGLYTRQVDSRRGYIDPSDIEQAILDQSREGVETKLLVLENTHNVHGGAVLTGEQVGDMVRAAHDHRVAVHLDGARLFNAAVALGVPVSDLAAGCDSVMVSLSKGLCAPAGSVLVGSSALVSRARQVKKMLGGPRQDGILAAAGIVALTEMVERLAEDHRNARLLEGLLGRIPGLSVETEGLRTNVVFFRVSAAQCPAATLVKALAERGVRALPIGEDRVRMVVYRGITAELVTAAARVVGEVMGSPH